MYKSQISQNALQSSQEKPASPGLQAASEQKSSGDNSQKGSLAEAKSEVDILAF